METPLLQTKLYIPPVRSQLVSRPRLIERLNEGPRSGRKLTLISAPAGFGKTTLISDWLNQRAEGGGLKDESGKTIQPSSFSLHPSRVAWVSLDEDDNDPTRFWAYVIAAFQTIQAGIGETADIASESSHPPPADPALTDLLNQVAQVPDPVVLVLDDYHVIEAEQVHAGLSYLLEHQPPNLHLVLLTRVDPSISLARLRAHDRLVEIRARDLQFSYDEAAILFNDVVNLNLKPEQVESLNRRAEGWIVGLNLAALSLKGQPASERIIERFTGSHQFILDYLTEEVLDTLPENQRDLPRECGRPYANKRFFLRHSAPAAAHPAGTVQRHKAAATGFPSASFVQLLFCALSTADVTTV